MATECLICIYYGGKLVIAYWSRGDGIPQCQGVWMLEDLRGGIEVALKEGLKHVQGVLFHDVPAVKRALQDVECKDPNRFNTGPCYCEACYTRARWYTIDNRQGGILLKLISEATALQPCAIAFFPRYANDYSCEFAYVIDLDERVFEVYGSGLPKSYGLGKRFDDIGQQTSFVPAIIKSFPLDDLPTNSVFNESVEAAKQEIWEKYGFSNQVEKRRYQDRDYESTAYGGRANQPHSTSHRHLFTTRTFHSPAPQASSMIAGRLFGRPAAPQRILRCGRAAPSISSRPRPLLHLRRLPTPTLPSVDRTATLRPSSARPFTTSAARRVSPREQPRPQWREVPQRQRGFDVPEDTKPLVTSEQLQALFRGPSFRVVIAVGVAGGLVFYFVNIDEVPVTRRQRFNCMSDAAMEKMGEIEYRRLMHELRGHILPDYDSRVQVVKRVMKRLIPVSGLPEDTDWEVFVIDDKGTQNAFVIPGGKVFVFSGILPICGSDDGLAAVLGHEIAHTLAKHAAERQSQTWMIQPLIWGVYAVDMTGIIGPILMRIALDLGIQRPAGRKQESEADYIGLMMMAQACYNPAAAVGLWQRMQQAHQDGPPEWLSTHPSNESRIENIQEWLPKAHEQREQSDCAVTNNLAHQFYRVIQPVF